MWEEYKVQPEHISVYEARKIFFPVYVVTEIKKNKKTGETNINYILRFPEGDKKQIIFEKVKNLEPNITWTYTKNGELEEYNYDKADAYVVGKAGLSIKNLI